MLYLIVILFYWIVIYKFQKHFSKKIMSSKSLDETISIKKRYKKYYIICLFWLFVLNYIYVCVIFYYLNGYKDSGACFINALCYTILGKYSSHYFTKYKEFNPLSLLTIKDPQWAKYPFSLFLRGFETDVDLPENELCLTKDVEFSEYLFNRQLSKRQIKLYAVGRPKELLSPWGAKRIYLDDLTWQEDVLRLMNRSSTIFILVNKKENCIWEIEQSLSMLDKTCFIVVDYDEYNQVKETLKDKIIMPDFQQAEVSLPFCFRLISFPQTVLLEGEPSDEKIICIYNEYKNTSKGYKKLIKKLYGKKGFFESVFN